MPKAPETRKYSFSDAALKQRGDSVVTCLVRDAQDFTARGVVAEDRTGIESLISQFDEFTTDDELLGEVTTATEVKNTYRQNLETQVRLVRGIAQVFYQGKGTYRKFGFDGMSQLSDEKLHRLSKRVLRVLADHGDELLTAGLTPAVVTTLTTLSTGFDDAIDTMDEKVKLRDIATQERVVNGNILYTELSRICNIGKNIYQDIDEARYNDYVLAGSSSTPPPVVPVPVP
jgi:hypothetical protein